MPITTSEIAYLRKIIVTAEKLIAKAEPARRGRPPKTGARLQAKAKSPKRIRRSGKELQTFRKMLITERKKGTPVAQLSAQHGISPAYIYQL
ncbi:MAG: hypothetical protein EB015_09965 [Methylocystaceae bacterium]|nr:hypothetical protein [Methylocystaceae bacterium]